MINTNVEALKDSAGRRIVYLDLSNAHKGNDKLFSEIHNKCMNKEVGEAFYSYLRTVITDNQANEFYGQSEQRGFPETENKKVAISSQIHSSYKFVKD